MSAMRLFGFFPGNPATNGGIDAARRSRLRYRRVAFSIVANIISKSAALVVMVLSVSLTITYLGPERFGVWVTIAGFAAMLAFLDFGVGNALTNDVARRAAGGDMASVCHAITAGLGLLLAIGLAASLVILIVAVAVPWEALIQSDHNAGRDEVRRAGIVFAALLGPCLVANGAHRVFAGLQLSFVGHIASAAGSLISIPLLILASVMRAEVPWLVALVLGIQLVVGIALLVVLTARDLIRWSDMIGATRAEARPLLRSGGLFLVLQLGAVAAFGADNLIISSTLGVTQVAVFAVAQRLFQFVSQPVAMLSAPLWSAYADAHHRGEKYVIRQMLSTSLALSLVLGLLLAALVSWWSPSLVERWTSGRLNVPGSLVMIFAVWVVIEALGASFSMFLNGCGIVRPQVVTVIALMLCALPTKIFAATQWGLQGMIGSYLVLYVLIVAGMYGVVFRRQVTECLQ